MKITLIAFVLLSCLAVSRESTGGAEINPDTKDIRGTWLPDKAEMAGQTFPADTLKTIVLKIADGTWEVMVGGHPDVGTFTLEPLAKPKGMTLVGTKGPNQGRTIPCIYELNGDKLRICYDLSCTKRPSDFKTSAGTKLYMVEYTRKGALPKD